MLCCKCKKNLAVVYISRMDEAGKTVNEGYCLTCAKELNIGPVNEMMEKMGINPEEMDGLNKEMSAMMEEMGDQFPDGVGLSGMLGGETEDDEEDDGEQMSRSMQKNPFEMMNRIFGGGKTADSGETDAEKKDEKKTAGKTKKEKKKN